MRRSGDADVVGEPVDRRIRQAVHPPESGRYRNEVPKDGAHADRQGKDRHDDHPQELDRPRLIPAAQRRAHQLDATAAGAGPAAMGNFLAGLARMNPSSISFDTAIDSVAWSTGRQVVAGPPVWNCGTEDANEQIVISHISFTEPGQNQPGKPAYQYVTHTRT